jgi:signal transduction histidine kinase
LHDLEKMDAMARLASTIAHDMKNLLAAIRFAAAGMGSPNGPDDLVEDLRTIRSALERADELTRQLGRFSSPEFGAREHVKLQSSLERLLPVIRGLAGEKVRVDARVDPDAATVFIDPFQCDQVIMNLAINARDAMDRGGSLRFEIGEVVLDDRYAEEHPPAKPGRYVCLVVEDTGHGMSEEVRRRIFEPYFTTKGARGGTGLGLSSVHAIVAQNGGDIDVWSEPGVGTRFTLHFPVADTRSTNERG